MGTSDKEQNHILAITNVDDISKIALFVQFDNDEPFEIMSGFGKEVTLKMELDNGTIEFTDIESGKKFKIYIKHCH